MQLTEEDKKALEYTFKILLTQVAPWAESHDPLIKEHVNQCRKAMSVIIKVAY